MRTWLAGGVLCLVFVYLSAQALAEPSPNLLEDPSFEVPKQRDQFGLVFAKWGGWKYEGDCSFAVGRVARTGKHSCLLVGGAGAKIRTTQLRVLEPGRYQITAFLRGLDIGTGTWNSTTEFMFDGKYMQLNKNGTFGWTKLTYVADIIEKKQAGPSFGMFAPGYFWVDDVSLVRVGNEVPLTDAPVLSSEETPIAPPGDLTAEAVRCPECAYRNMPAWKQCYACGSSLEVTKTVVSGPPVKLITSLEDENPFSGGEVVAQHATDGNKAMRIDRSYAVMDGPQDWSGYDYLKADLHVETDDPLELYVEVRDTATRDYWTRVNYTTVAPPGQSTLIIPIKQLYVGEKSRPGRMLMLGGITRLVFSIGENPKAPLFLDNIRLERDTSTQEVTFDGLHAFDFGPGGSPVMDGFQAITPSSIYSQGRGYGLKDAQVWRIFDALQPDPLYQDFICIERGEMAVDVPNGKYRVFVNIDSPSAFWGEYQVYRERAILAEGKPVVTDKMDFTEFQEKYFRFWLTVKTPDDLKAGLYKGVLTISPQQGGSAKVPVEFRVRAGTLDPVDIPAGPWGYTISVPWYGEDPTAAAWNQSMIERSLRKMREYGFTTCSGIPSIPYRGFQNGKPVLDFAAADARMKLAKDLGFLAVVSYGGGVSGFNAYFQDTGAMKTAGFKDYSEFVKAVYTAVQQHADQHDWIPVYYNLGDEPIGDALTRSAENAEAYRKAFPQGPPLFTAASSFSGSDRDDPHFRLSKALHVADWNGHDEDSVKLLHEAGSDWAFYNGGNRWTFGDYLYKATKQFRMKFRLSWHWNVVAGDPYYALDCREDDYAWCNSSPDGQLIPAIRFEQLREGLDDYRRLLTAARLAKERAGTPAAEAARQLITKRLATFKLGQRDHDSLLGPEDWTRFRTQIDDAIEALRR